MISEFIGTPTPVWTWTELPTFSNLPCSHTVGTIVAILVMAMSDNEVGPNEMGL